MTLIPPNLKNKIFSILTIPINNKLLLDFNTNEDPNNNVNQKIIITLMSL